VKWLTGIMNVRDESGKEKLVARYDRRKGLGERYEQGLMVYNDEKEVFEKAVALEKDARLVPDGVPFKVKDYYYFPGSTIAPLVRVKATLKSVLDANAYEGFVDGVWKAGARPQKLRTQIDIETGQAIEAAGSVNWNAYRKRWIMLAWRFPDQTYYFEADTPVGPWVYGRRVVKYDHYTFYNVAHHPFFDSENGRVIYFEGTYTREFSDAPVATPRYNYNQLMYRLDLSDPRLVLPVPVYRVGGRYLVAEQIERENLWGKIEAIPFFAFDRASEGLIAADGGNFFALPLDSKSTSPGLMDFPADRPLVRVYRNPQKQWLLDGSARPAGE
jgi:hypothetical protein